MNTHPARNLPTDNVVPQTVTPMTAPAVPEGGPEATPADTIDALNRLLRHELAATDAYQGALDLVPDRAADKILQSLLADHQRRAAALHARILARAGHPVAAPGAWVRVAESSPSLMSTDMVVASLQELEGRGVASYRGELNNLDDVTRTEIEAELLPGQECALATIADAKSPGGKDPV